MDALFQRPLGPSFSILNFPKKILVKADIKQLSPKIVWEVLMKIEGIQAIIRTRRAESAPARVF